MNANTVTTATPLEVNAQSQNGQQDDRDKKVGYWFRHEFLSTGQPYCELLGNLTGPGRCPHVCHCLDLARAIRKQK